ncbi:MAG: hypothetical protein GC162_08910 [Planctomycetes bacterium]|nr:hypothetical protein [Planctomycetota bacterium]
MNHNADNPLPELLAAYLDGRLSADELREFAAWVDTNDDSRRQYVQLCYLTSLLAETAGDVLGQVREMSREEGFRVQGSGFRFKAAIAALITLAAALTYWYLLPTPHSQLPAPHSPVSFAILSDLSSDAQFADGDRPLGEGLTGPIELTAGRAQLMFSSTAVVDLTGPCRFEMTGPNRGKLAAGALEAYVPKNARGFTIDGPNGMKAVDLGTRFKLAIDDAGRPSLDVMTGRVEFTAPGGVGMKTTLAAGQKLVLDASGRPRITTLPLIAFVGVDHGVGAHLRTGSVPKHLDADGDNLYGSAGHVYWNTTPIASADGPLNGHNAERPAANRRLRLPPFIAQLVESPDTTAARDFGYAPIDDPQAPLSKSMPQVESGMLVHSVSGDAQALTMVRLVVGRDVPAGGFRLGVLIDCTDKTHLNPRRLSLVSGQSSATAEVDEQTLDGVGDVLLFDVLEARPGDEIELRVIPWGDLKSTVISAMTFDVLPKPRITKERQP